MLQLTCRRMACHAPTYLPPHSTWYSMHSLFEDLNISLYKPLEYTFEKNRQAPPYTRDAMRVRSRRTNWGEWMTCLSWQESNYMQERGKWWRGRSRARGWQWQGRLLWRVVAVASQGILPKEGHQVAKLEHANAWSKLQHGLPCSNLLAAMLHLIFDAFIVPRLEYFII
jgi:hypothetical protein